MSLSLHNIRFTDSKELSVELEFIIACNKIEGNELIRVKLENTELVQKFRTAAARHLKAAKKDGVIRLFVFEDELSQEKTESIYLLNKYPSLADKSSTETGVIYIKL